MWLVNPTTQVLEMYRLTGEYHTQVAVAGGQEKERFEPFHVVELDMNPGWEAG